MIVSYRIVVGTKVGDRPHHRYIAYNTSTHCGVVNLSISVPLLVLKNTIIACYGSYCSNDLILTISAQRYIRHILPDRKQQWQNGMGHSPSHLGTKF